MKEKNKNNNKNNNKKEDYQFNNLLFYYVKTIFELFFADFI
jgi:hypothetical protein